MQLNVTNDTPVAKSSSLPWAGRVVAALLIVGACASGASCLSLLFPQSALRHIWRLNPEAGPQLLALGAAGILLMGAVCVACTLASAGLLRQRRWGYTLALAILAVNVTADAVSAFVRDDMRTLIGVPIGVALIVWLLPAFRRVVRDS